MMIWDKQRKGVNVGLMVKVVHKRHKTLASVKVAGACGLLSRPEVIILSGISTILTLFTNNK